MKLWFHICNTEVWYVHCSYASGQCEMQREILRKGDNLLGYFYAVYVLWTPIYSTMCDKLRKEYFSLPESSLAASSSASLSGSVF